MASIIWCDHVKHVVTESRSEVEAALEGKGDFAYFRVIEKHGAAGLFPQQRALRLSMISSYEAVPGDGV